MYAKNENGILIFPPQNKDNILNYNQNSSENLIEIRNFVYLPKTLTISVGDSVTWINYDSSKHTITSDTGSVLDSELFGQGETYSMTFTEAGTYNYHCTPHPYMKGKIIVE